MTAGRGTQARHPASAVAVSFFNVFCRLTDLSVADLAASHVNRHVRVLAGHAPDGIAGEWSCVA